MKKPSEETVKLSQHLLMLMAVLDLSVGIIVLRKSLRVPKADKTAQSFPEHCPHPCFAMSPGRNRRATEHDVLKSQEGNMLDNH